jgi:UDP-2,3-diacylglucosamine pyrophosphatase LpxH
MKPWWRRSWARTPWAIINRILSRPTRGVSTLACTQVQTKIRLYAKKSCLMNLSDLRTLTCYGIILRNELDAAKTYLIWLQEKWVAICLLKSKRLSNRVECLYSQRHRRKRNPNPLYKTQMSWSLSSLSQSRQTTRVSKSWLSKTERS